MTNPNKDTPVVGLRGDLGSSLRDTLPGADRAAVVWLIEAPGTNYLAVRALGRSEFYWTPDHNKALRFYSKEQADQTAMAVRQLVPDLWAFALTLGEAWPREHKWAGTDGGAGLPTTEAEWSELGDLISDAISDSIDMDWQPRWGARAVVALLQRREQRQDDEPCLSVAEQKAQAGRCGCGGSDDYCPCQNEADAQTRAARS